MPLESISNAQFMNFVSFARDAEANGNVKTIARLGEQNELGVHTIVVQTGDKIGALRRSGRIMRSNDDIRNEFKACIVDMFGGARNVPKDVVEAMKLNDNGEGKPLTARRILAVTRAIEPLAERLGRVKAVAVEKLEEKAQDPEVMNLVDMALKRCLADADAADLVASAINRVVMSNGKPRSEDDVLKLVDKFMACAKDLRKAANDNQRIIDIGKKFFAHYRRPLEAGMFANIVRTLGSKSISSLKGLTANSGPGDLYKAVSRLTTNINDTLVKVGARNLLDGADEIELFKGLLIELSLERCGTNAVRWISEALRSESASKIYSFFEDVYSRRLAGDGTSFGLQNNASNFADQDKNVLVILLETTDALLGKNDNYEYVYDIDVADAIPDEEWAPGALSNVYRRAEKSGKEQHDAFVNSFVSGKGPGAKLLKDVYTDYSGEYAFEPKPMFINAARHMGKALLNWNVASECKLMAEGRLHETKFAAGLATKLTVTLPDGTALSKNLDEACDQIASFVTEGKVRSYAALKGENRTKAHIVMSMLSMETAKIASDAHFIAASKPSMTDMRFTPALTETSDTAKDKHTLAITVGEDGKLVFGYTGEKSLKSLTRTTEDDGEEQKETVNVARGSKSTSTLTFSLAKEEFDRLAKLDFTKFDDTDAKAARDGGEESPTLVVGHFKKEFLVEGSCEIDHKAHLAG